MSSNEALEALLATLGAAARADSPSRSGLLSQALIDAGMLVQGLLDAEFKKRGFDELSPLHVAGMELLAELARGCARGEPAGLPEATALGALETPALIDITTPEGYAFYAIYPEAYQQAAEAFAWDAPPLVVGLRSIGVGLAAVVAAAARATAVVSVRPCGAPLRRELRLSPSFQDRLASHPGPFAIVDEGPGLSGSSFGCFADLLEGLGVERRRIVFFPSHGGDLGPQASEEHRRRWRKARRIVRTLDDLLFERPIASWFADLTGEALEVEDLSAGAWRGGSATIPAWPARERRKFRIRSVDGVWLAKFAGLGETGLSKFARAEALFKAGFAPQPIALRNGFLLQRWEDGEAVDPGGPHRPAFLQHLARYLAFRARAFPAGGHEGADAATLCEMVRINAGLDLSPPSPAPPVHVDAKLQPYEWLRRPDGSFCKLDALDHSCAHDIVGCQEIAWDVAGARIEFNLSPEELSELITGVEQAGGPRLEPPTVDFFETCYAAFHYGLWSIAGANPLADNERRRYERRLARDRARSFFCDRAASIEIRREATSFGG